VPQPAADPGADEDAVVDVYADPEAETAADADAGDDASTYIVPSTYTVALPARPLLLSACATTVPATVRLPLQRAAALTVAGCPRGPGERLALAVLARSLSHSLSQQTTAQAPPLVTWTALTASTSTSVAGTASGGAGGYALRTVLRGLFERAFLVPFAAAGGDDAGAGAGQGVYAGGRQSWVVIVLLDTPADGAAAADTATAAAAASVAAAALAEVEPLTALVNADVVSASPGASEFVSAHVVMCTHIAGPRGGLTFAPAPTPRSASEATKTSAAAAAAAAATADVAVASATHALVLAPTLAFSDLPCYCSGSSAGSGDEIGPSALTHLLQRLRLTAQPGSLAVTVAAVLASVAAAAAAVEAGDCAVVAADWDPAPAPLEPRDTGATTIDIGTFIESD
jgi:hypothetical protein